MLCKEHAKLDAESRAVWMNHTCAACLADRIDSLEREVREAKENIEMADGCLAMVRETLESVGCCHGHDMSATPPMFYNDAIRCAIGKREKIIREQQAIIAKLPKTADGVPVVPGMTVWREHPDGGGVIVVRPVLWVSRYLACLAVDGEVEADSCYSTRAAAEQAKGAKDGH